jgi:hypothetical protein
MKSVLVKGSLIDRRYADTAQALRDAKPDSVHGLKIGSVNDPVLSEPLIKLGPNQLFCATILDRADFNYAAETGCKHLP